MNPKKELLWGLWVVHMAMGLQQLRSPGEMVGVAEKSRNNMLGFKAGLSTWSKITSSISRFKGLSRN